MYQTLNANLYFKTFNPTKTNWSRKYLWPLIKKKVILDKIFDALFKRKSMLIAQKQKNFKCMLI